MAQPLQQLQTTPRIKVADEIINIPCDLDSEELILSSLLFEGVNALPRLQEAGLLPEHFYVSSHQTIYSAAFECYADDDPIDLMGITTKLAHSGKLDTCGGQPYLAKLLELHFSSANIDFAAQHLINLHIKRQAIDIGRELANIASDKSTTSQEVIDIAQDRMIALVQPKIRKSVVTAEEVATILLGELEQKINNPVEQSSIVPSGYYDLDELIYGLEGGTLTIAAARPRTGKSTLIQNLVNNISINGVAQRRTRCHIFSLEMSKNQWFNRFLVQRSLGLLTMRELKTGQLPADKFVGYGECLSDISQGLWSITDHSDFTVDDVCTTIKLEYQKYLGTPHPLKVVFVDYLGLLDRSLDNSHKANALGNICKRLRACAKELNIAIVAAHQLSRAIEMRSQDSEPQLSDLANSGAIEQDSDKIIMLRRADNQLMLYVVKNRDGSEGRISLLSLPEYYDLRNMQGYGSASTTQIYDEDAY